MRRILSLLVTALLFIQQGYTQTTFPVNGIATPTEGYYAFTHAIIVKDAHNILQNATMIIRDKKIIEIGTGITVPKEAVAVDCSGKYIYPSFIDLYSDYGIASAPLPQRGGFNFNAPSQITSNTKGAFGWNQAIRPEIDASTLFTNDETKAKPLRDIGFGTVLTHQKDGIARGTGALVTLANLADNFVVIKEKASANYSFSKGTSTQSYPSSIMGSIALLRQTYLDALWYKNKPASEGTNLSLQAWNNNQNLPQVFEGNDKWSDIRADRIGDEFGVQYIIKGGGNEYQRINEIAATKASFILPLNYPAAMDVDDPNDARFVSLADMKHWEMAPTNPAAFEKANIRFCFTTADLRDPRLFMTNLRKAMDYGLSETKALEALTEYPATMLGVYDKVGSLEKDKLANFIITTGPIFNERTSILQNWIQGEKYIVKDDEWKNIAGTYKLVLTSGTKSTNYVLDVKSSSAATVVSRDSLTTRFSSDGKLVKIFFSPIASRRRGGRQTDTTARLADTARIRTTPPNIAMNQDSSAEKRPRDDRMPPQQQLPTGADRIFGRQTPSAPAGPSIRLSGVSSGNTWQGNGVDTSGNPLLWTATLVSLATPKEDTVKKKEVPKLGKVTFPFGGYGWEEMPKQEDLLIKNATIWTNEKEGILQNADVLVKNGKIAQVGKNLSSSSAKVIDGTGKYLTPGIVDEHSHIAVSSINEGGQSVTSEVRIADNLNPEDINIYRQLSGGVTTSHILHGSANSIGGQTQLIKLRWGVTDTALKFIGADPFIKFALGENVKRTTSNNNNRFPDTRMGVEEVVVDAFTRAKDYQREKKESQASGKSFRRDLELDALVEILEHKRFITCHSYLQSEITASMRIADKFGFKYNTFTHILEGYKVADKMKLHGANAGTFSDWWNYKTEVMDAIPQNAALMQRMGINVAINSDDAEMARRLNQEAAKSIKYAGMSEEDAFKMVTLNPAIMLHVQDRVGSIKVGKDADLVLWTDNPLSIYAKAVTTIVDGIIYFDRERDMLLREKMKQEKNRLIQKLAGERRAGTTMVPAQASTEILLRCEDDNIVSGIIENNN